MLNHFLFNAKKPFWFCLLKMFDSVVAVVVDLQNNEKWFFPTYLNWNPPNTNVFEWFYSVVNNMFLPSHFITASLWGNFSFSKHLFLWFKHFNMRFWVLNQGFLTCLFKFIICPDKTKTSIKNCTINYIFGHARTFINM